MAHQLSASNVGGDTRDDSAKNNLYLESQNHSFASIMGCSFEVHKNRNNFSGLTLLNYSLTL